MVQILSIGEVTERLDSLDLASPNLDKAKVEACVQRFYSRLRMTAPEPVWFPSTHEYNQRLLDRDIYGTSCFSQHSEMEGFRSHHSAIYHTLRRVDHNGPIRDLIAISAQHHVLTALRETSPFAFDCWRYLLIHDDAVLEAVEAGLGWLLIKPGVLILIPRPVFRMHRERYGQALHSFSGPAVEFAEEPAGNQWWIRGVRVKQFVVEQPERITRAHIRAARSTRERRALIDQYGLLKYSIERGFRPIDHAEQFGVVLYARGGNRSAYGEVTRRECILKLINSTPEPDGSYRHYARRVPGNMQSAHEAVAWTFGLPKESYNPSVQT